LVEVGRERKAHPTEYLKTARYRFHECGIALMPYPIVLTPTAARSATRRVDQLARRIARFDEMGDVTVFAISFQFVHDHADDDCSVGLPVFGWLIVMSAWAKVSP